MDPVDDVPWAMQLAVRYDKARLPSHAQVCQAAARAVVCLLTDARATDDGPWAASVRRWRDGRIRKLVRRARGVHWEEVQALPGVTVAEGSAAVRAVVPGPVRPLPPELNRLQVSGTAFPQVGDGPSDPFVSGRLVTIALTPYADLTTGKSAAQ